MNQENQKKIDFLNLQIERISNENLAQKVLIDALILSHQNHRNLAACINREKDMFLARAISENMPDETINSVSKDIDRALKHAIALS
jgi:hypothetical protein